MRYLTTTELIHLSAVPKSDIVVKIHFACKRLNKILDRIVGAE